MDVMVLNSNGSDLKQALEVQHIFDRRNKIILHNNYCILETVSFYEHVLLNNVIKPFFFNDNYTKYCEISEVIDERLSFMDRFKIVKKIAKIFSVSDFKKIDNFIKLRNRIAHNLSSVSALNIETKENEISFSITGENLGKLIGYHGDNIQAIQMLLSGLKLRSEWPVRMYVDIGGYKQNKDQAVIDLAIKTADQAVKIERNIHLDPMNAYTRRIVHTTLQSRDDVTTESTGEGEKRHVVIKPIFKK